MRSRRRNHVGVRRVPGLALLAALALAGAGCGDSPTEPNRRPEVDVAGDWSGTWTFEVAGLMVTDELTVRLNQSGNSVSGTWSADGGASGQITFDATAVVSGTLTISQPLLGSTFCNGSTTITGTASATRLDIRLADVAPQGVCQWGTDNRFVLTR